MKKLLLFFTLIFSFVLVACNEQPQTQQPQDPPQQEQPEEKPNENPNEEKPEIEKVEFNPSENARRLVLSAKNNTNTATSTWEAEYSKSGITFNILVEDDDLYIGNIYNVGYDDNVEFLINLKNNKSGWVVGGTYHFLISGDGKTLFERATTSSGLGGSYDTSLGVVLGENLNYTFRKMTTEEGFSGYMASVYLSYDVLNTTYEEAYGNLTFCPGMRNSHTYQVDSVWVPYSKRNCNWGNSSTFVSINSDGTFGEKLNQTLDILYLGDTLLETSSWTRFNYDNEDKSVLNVSSTSSTIKNWINDIEDYSECTIKDMVLYLGYTDIMNNTQNLIDSLIEKIHILFPKTNIYLISIVALSNDDDIDSINVYNDKLKQLDTLNDYIKYIDITDKLTEDGVIRSSLIYSNKKLNYLGNNILYEVINNSLKLKNNSLPNVFGSNNVYSSSSGFKLIDNYIDGAMDKDQYLIFSKNASNNVDASISISAKEVYNGDAYPKFGIVLMSKNDTLFFYIDGSNNLSKQTVGYVKGKNHTSWQWANSVESNVAINYSNGNFQKLRAVKNGNDILLYVDDQLVFEVSNFFEDNELVTVGVLSFNTHIMIKDYNIE